MFHLMDFGAKPESHVWIEAILEVLKVMFAPSEQLHKEKFLTALGVKYLLAHVVTRHFTLATGASTTNEDAFFTRKSLPRSSSA